MNYEEVLHRCYAFFKSLFETVAKYFNNLHVMMGTNEFAVAWKDYLKT